MTPAATAHPTLCKRYGKALRLQADAERLATCRRLHTPGAAWPEITQGMREVGTRRLGARTKGGAARLTMASVGGAVLPVVMGHVSDAGASQTAYLVPARCFLMVLGFALRNGAVKRCATVR